MCGVSGIVLTERAKEYLKKVGSPNVSLSVKGGGCSGFQYEWGVTDKSPTVENLWLDPMAEMFVFGCTVDYVEELGGSYLKVINPNATASCGCGESFAVQEKEMNIRVVSKSDCPFCKMAKTWFEDHGFPYEEQLMDNEEERLAFYQSLTNGVGEIVGQSDTVRRVNSVPQIFIDDKRIGGYDELMKMAPELLKKRSSGGLMKFSETYKPFHYPWAVEITTRHEKVHWIEDELDLSEDVADWKSGKVSEIEKEYITNILRLFTQSDVAVGQNYYDQLIPKFKNNEVRNMLGSFANREAIHQRAYALLNETLGLSDAEYHAFLEYQEMADKIEFMMDSDPNTVRGLGCF